MRPFRYARARTIADAVAAATPNGRARFVAGGTNILDLMKVSVEQPALLVDINRLPLWGIDATADGGVSIGALARMSDVAADHFVRSRYPMVAIALEQSASPQLRNMASMGGNLLQRTRCAYFRDVAAPCNKRSPGSGCGAMQGENRMEAVLGTSERCIATHASDVAVALMALDAVVHVTGPRGERSIALRDFYRLPGATPHIETSLGRGELITALSLPPLSFSARSTYLKVRDRTQYEFALASAAVAVDVAGGTIRQCRIALGGVATVPWRSHEAERSLAGAPPSRANFQRAAEAALAAARGHGKNDFKIALAKRTIVRALEIVAA